MGEIMNRIIRLYLLLSLSCLAVPLFAQQDKDVQASLLEKAALVQRFSRMYPQEKAYLHFDNTGYFIGETIWFKAYVTRTDTDRPTDLSGVLYVELLNPAGDVVERRKLELKDGQGRGDIRLDKILTSGFYEVRAYTRYMANWGTGACFSRVFPIFDEPERAGDYSKASIDRSTRKHRMPSVREDAETEGRDAEEAGTVEMPARPRGAYAAESRGVTLRLYPEGGSHVEGLEGKVAFRLTDDEGRPVTGTARLSAPDGGSETPEIAVDSLGRGLFVYTPRADMPVDFVLSRPGSRTLRFTLPAGEREGCALRVNALAGDRVRVEAAVSPGLHGRLWGMTLQNGGLVVATHSFRTGMAPHTFYFNRGDMPPGVSQITIFDGDGRIWAERQVFIPPRPSKKDSIRLRVETGQLRPCGKVRLTAEAAPGSTFSFSARDIASSTGGYNGDIRTWMLLCSELRGYVHRPEYYFEADDAEHREAADLLMLTQGWRRYDWQVMAGEEPFKPEYPAEDGLYLDGRVYPAKRRQRTDGVRLTSYLYNRAGESLKGETRTDSAGHYAFSLPDCTGRWSLFLKAEGRKEKEDFRIGISRNFAPMPRTYDWGETRPEAESLHRRLRFGGFENTDTLAPPQEKRHILMPTVHVDERWVYENPRVAWETEAVGRRKAFLYYDCDAAVDWLSDRGEEIPTFQDWLKERNGYFVGETYMVHDETPEEHLEDEIKLMNPGFNPDYGDFDRGSDKAIARNNPGISKDDRFKLLLGEMRIGSPVIDREYHIYKDGLTYDNRPIVWVIDNSYHSLTGVNYNHPPNPGVPEEVAGEGESLMGTGSTSSTAFPTKPELRVAYCRTTTHRTAEMPLFLDEVKSVYVAEDQSTWRQFIRFMNENIQMPVTVFVYTHHAFAGRVKGLRRTYFQGYNVPSTFEMNDYSVLPPMEDFRRTLYWNPDVTTDKDGKAVIEFYNNSTCREIQVSAEGITPDGRCIFNE